MAQLGGFGLDNQGDAPKMSEANRRGHSSEARTRRARKRVRAAAAKYGKSLRSRGKKLAAVGEKRGEKGAEGLGKGRSVRGIEGSEKEKLQKSGENGKNKTMNKFPLAMRCQIVYNSVTKCQGRVDRVSQSRRERDRTS